MDASLLQHCVPLGPCLEIGASLGNAMIYIFKIRYQGYHGACFFISFWVVFLIHVSSRRILVFNFLSVQNVSFDLFQQVCFILNFSYVQLVQNRVRSISMQV